MPAAEIPAVAVPPVSACTPPAIAPPLPRAVVSYTRRPDGAVIAACHGATGAGWSEDDALIDLGYNLLAGVTPAG